MDWSPKNGTVITREAFLPQLTWKMPRESSGEGKNEKKVPEERLGRWIFLPGERGSGEWVVLFFDAS